MPGRKIISKRGTSATLNIGFTRIIRYQWMEFERLTINCDREVVLMESEFFDQGSFRQWEIDGNPPDFTSVLTPSPLFKDEGFLDFDLAITTIPDFTFPAIQQGNHNPQLEANRPPEEPPAQPPDQTGPGAGRLNNDALLNPIGRDIQQNQEEQTSGFEARNDNSIKGPVMTAFRKAIKASGDAKLTHFLPYARNFQGNLDCFEKIFSLVECSFDSMSNAKQFFLEAREKILEHGRKKYIWMNLPRYHSYLKYCEIIFNAFENGVDFQDRLKRLYGNKKYLSKVSQVEKFINKLRAKKPKP